MKTALIVIDVQSYFLKHAPAALPAKIAAHIRQSSYDCVAFTIFQNMPGSSYERKLHWKRCEDEADLQLPLDFQGLATDRNTFIKHTYSALKQPNVVAYLKQHAIEKVDICGIDLDACVLATAYEAFDVGYEVEVLFELSHSRIGLDEAAKAIILRTIDIKNTAR